MRRRIFIYIILLEFILIGILVYAIFSKQENTLGVSVNNIKKDDIIASQSSSLKYFYEPVVGVIKQEPDENVYPAVYNINSDHLNSNREYSVEKPAGVYRIIALGDSFTFGLNVNTSENWVSKLESILNNEFKCEKYNNFEVLNLGVGGYDTTYSAERYKKRGHKYHPDLVLWLHFDMKRITELLQPLFLKYYSEALNTDEYKNAQDRGGAYAWDKAHREIRNKLGDKKILAHNFKALDLLDNVYDGKLAYLVIPGTVSGEEARLLKKHIEKKENGYFINKIRNIFDSGDILKGDGHPSPTGHSMIAEDIANYLIDNKVINCN